MVVVDHKYLKAQFCLCSARLMLVSFWLKHYAKQKWPAEQTALCKKTLWSIVLSSWTFTKVVCTLLCDTAQWISSCGSWVCKLLCEICSLCCNYYCVVCELLYKLIHTITLQATHNTPFILTHNNVCKQFAELTFANCLHRFVNLVETILQSTIFISFALGVVAIWSIGLKKYHPPNFVLYSRQ